MNSSAAVTESMQRISATKLKALSNQHADYEATKSAILAEVGKANTASERVGLLLDRFEEKKLPMPASFSSKTMRAFLEQSKHDSSVSPALLDSWESHLKQSLDIPSRKYEHASLFGKLAMEWLESGRAATPEREMGDSFESIGRQEQHEQRKEWERLVLSDRSDVDAGIIENYLKQLFKAPLEAQSALKRMRDAVEKFKMQPLNPDSLKVTISQLLKSDLLSHKKQAALKNFRDNRLVLSEIADVLNMQLESLQSWSWDVEAVELDVRRGLNGKYRVFMDEELLTAILLQYMGLRWAVFL